MPVVAGDQPEVLDADSSCRSAEDCFRSALVPFPSSVPSEDRRRLQAERLKLLRERFPESLWAKRAGVLLGVLLSEREPAEAVRLLEAARQELPLLEDYLRFWRAEALVRAGDSAQAAALFESIPQEVPDTLLRNRAAFAGGQAWFLAGDCKKATELLQRAVSLEPQDSAGPPALLSVAECQMRDNRLEDSRATLKQIWVKYPQTPAAREALMRLSKVSDEEVWRPSPDDLYARAFSFLNLSLHAEAVEEIQKFLAVAPRHPRRDEAKLKLGTALMRLKRYDQARPVFQDLAAQRAEGAGDAVMSLARISLRLGDGEGLLAMRQALPGLGLSGEQRASILMMVGIWLDDQRQYEEAIAAYREAAQPGASPSQWVEALWRTGWIHYRNGQWREAIERFQEALVGKDDPQWAPQVRYWRARALERQSDPSAAETYQQICRQYALTYYCQLARAHADPVTPLPSPPGVTAENGPVFRTDAREQMERDLHYRKAIELKFLKQEQEAARELASLTDRYGRDRGALLALATLLSEAGAHHEALRIARVNFRDSLERGGDPVPQALWNVAYPTIYLPAIRANAGIRLDPYLAAAIIREESQYDPRAVSRVGALGLMQLMPDTAKAVARRLGEPEGARGDLFNQETNIRYGTGYLDQLLEQFSGNVIYAVAAYNAGPTAVSSWIAKNGARDQEEFVELIPYQETRQYVKRVLRSYREYHRLGGEPCAVRLLDKVC
jgi:soluble lytic murein transglycosylase